MRQATSALHFTRIGVALLLLLTGWTCMDGSRALAADPPAAAPTVLQDAGALPGTVAITLADGVTLEFVLIMPGTFTMGSEKEAKKGNPPRQVTIAKPYYLGKYEVTQEQWQVIMDGNPSATKGAKLPVTKVSWQNCQKFLDNLNQKYGGPKTAVSAFRLPTEEEWEYACRAGTTTDYSFGDVAAGLDEYGWYKENSGNTTHEAGGKKPNAWGLYDMHGNVWEWCQNGQGDNAFLNVDPVTGSAKGLDEPVRGGSWLNPAALCTSTAKINMFQGILTGIVGFRVVGVCHATEKTATAWRPLYPDPAAAGRVD